MAQPSVLATEWQVCELLYLVGLPWPRLTAVDLAGASEDSQVQYTV